MCFVESEKKSKKKEKKRPYSVVVKSASLDNLKMNCVMVTFALPAYAVWGPVLGHSLHKSPV